MSLFDKINEQTLIYIFIIPICFIMWESLKNIILTDFTSVFSLMDKQSFFKEIIRLITKNDSYLTVISHIMFILSEFILIYFAYIIIGLLELVE